MAVSCESWESALDLVPMFRQVGNSGTPGVGLWMEQLVVGAIAYTLTYIGCR